MRLSSSSDDLKEILLLPTMMWGQLMTVIEKSGERKIKTNRFLERCKVRGRGTCCRIAGRETFNLYGSLRRRDIALWMADYELLNSLCTRGCVFAGSTSAILLKLDDISGFVFLTLEESMRRKMRRTQRRNLNGQKLQVKLIMRTFCAT
jgi:hypothetical protein